MRDRRERSGAGSRQSTPLKGVRRTGRSRTVEPTRVREILGGGGMGWKRNPNKRASGHLAGGPMGKTCSSAPCKGVP